MMTTFRKEWSLLTRRHLRVRSIHRQAPAQRGAGRTDGRAPVAEDGHMKKRLLITGIVAAALLLALYGVIFGTGAD
jgi:hypothetical protein